MYVDNVRNSDDKIAFKFFVSYSKIHLDVMNQTLTTE